MNTGDSEVQQAAETARIVEFPVRHVQNWVALERGMREVLAAAGSPPDMIQAVCRRMKPVFDQIQPQYELTCRLPLPRMTTEAEARAMRDAVTEAFAAVEKQLEAFSTRVLLERLSIEAELHVTRTLHKTAQPASKPKSHPIS